VEHSKKVNVKVIEQIDNEQICRGFNISIEIYIKWQLCLKFCSEIQYKRKPGEEKHEHSEKVKRLLEKNKEIRGHISTPDSINEI
jgi:hypothetical protein